jgi:hypothetical protein
LERVMNRTSPNSLGSGIPAKNGLASSTDLMTGAYVPSIVVLKLKVRRILVDRVV